MTLVHLLHLEPNVFNDCIFATLHIMQAVKEAARLFSWYRLGGDEELVPGEDGEEEDEHEGMAPPPFPLVPMDLPAVPNGAAGAGGGGAGGGILFMNNLFLHQGEGGGADYGFDSGSSDGDVE